jgi:hypothetical protein
MRVIEFSRLATLCVGAFLCAEAASAQTCEVPQRNFSKEVTIGGYYSYSAIGNGLPGSLVTTTGTGGTGVTTGTGGTGSTTGTGTGSTTGTTPPFTSTEVGQLLSGVSNTGPFASSGLLYLDASGNILAGPTTQTGLTTLVGTYKLNSSNCTITVTLKDAFGNNTTPTTLQGVVLRDGSEIDLGVLQNFTTGAICTVPSTGPCNGTGTGTGTGTSTATAVPTLYGSNIFVRLIRQQSPSCSVNDLAGSYALFGDGDRVATTVGGSTFSSTQAPFFTFGLVQFDGNGHIISQPATSSLSYLQFAGTYTVNSDCTGTMTLNNATNTPASGSNGGTTTSTNGTPVNFILIQPSASSGSTSPEISFSQFGNGQTMFGTGIAQ